MADGGGENQLAWKATLAPSAGASGKYLAHSTSNIQHQTKVKEEKTSKSFQQLKNTHQEMLPQSRWKLSKHYAIEFFFWFLFIYLFILAAPGLSLGTRDLLCGMRNLLAAACGLLSCGMQTLSCGMHAGSSSPTRDRIRAPCIGSAESYLLDHQGSPYAIEF